MPVQLVEERPHAPTFRVEFSGLRTLVSIVGVALLVYLCWRLVLPFLSAICWAVALALIADPLRSWLLRKRVMPSVAALLIILVTLALIAGPGAFLARSLTREATDIVNRIATDSNLADLRQKIETNSVSGPVLRWLDARFDIPAETIQLARSLGGWASASLKVVVTGSIAVLSQIGVALFFAFYLLRDKELILSKAKSVIPISPFVVESVSARVAQTIRVSLGGKLIVAAIQGTLGGLMFAWLEIPAPVFWATLMAALSVFPVIGAFIVWAPAALILALQGDWLHALVLTGWGVLVIHPVDNLLGPVLVGTTLHLHTLVMFFSIVGGIAAFGASGVVLGPITVAVAAALVEFHQNGRGGIVER